MENNDEFTEALLENRKTKRIWAIEREPNSDKFSYISNIDVLEQADRKQLKEEWLHLKKLDIDFTFNELLQGIAKCMIAGDQASQVQLQTVEIK
jgi:hypothetical protein